MSNLGFPHQPGEAEEIQPVDLDTEPEELTVEDDKPKAKKVTRKKKTE